MVLWVVLNTFNQLEKMMNVELLALITFVMAKIGTSVMFVLAFLDYSTKKAFFSMAMWFFVNSLLASALVVQAVKPVEIAGITFDTTFVFVVLMWTTIISVLCFFQATFVDWVKYEATQLERQKAKDLESR